MSTAPSAAAIGLGLAAGTPPAPAAAPTTLALRLGLAGLIPFVLGAVLVWLVRPDLQAVVADALAKYAALIASFLGGIHWGLGFLAPAGANDRNRRFVWGVLPSLIAWVAVLMPASAGLVLQALLLIGCYLVDRRVYPAHGLAAWLTLRFRLSAVAALSCFLAAAAMPLAPR